MTKNLYVFIQNITPPFIFKLLKNNKLYFLIKKYIKKIFNENYKSQVHSIKNGFLIDYKLFFDSSGEWQTQMLNDEYDKFMFDYVSKLDLKNKVIFDIGAHIGYHSIYFSKYVGERGEVYAFEPNIFNIERIKINLKANKQINNVQIKEIALSDKTGEETFVFSDDIENGTSSGGFLDSSDPLWQKDIYIKETGFKKISVETTTLDSLVNKNKDKKIDLLKIDVEGAENLVLNGGKDFIKTFQPTILMEVHSIFNMYKVLDILNDLSYKTTLLKKENDGRCFIACVYNSK